MGSALVIAGTFNEKLRTCLQFSGLFLGLLLSSGSFAARESYLFESLPSGQGAVALFYTPRDVAVGEAGVIYVADADNHVVRQIAPDGTTTTLAGVAGYRGGDDGKGEEARFSSPTQIERDRAGNLYILDYVPGDWSYTVAVRKVSPDGNVSTLLRSEVEWGDGGSGPKPWWSVSGMAVDPEGNVYLHDGNKRRICRIGPNGVVTTFLEENMVGYTVAGPMTFDAQGNLYVANWRREKLSRISPSGEVTRVLVAGEFGLYSGPEGNVQIDILNGLTVDPSGNVFASDHTHSRIYKIDPTGSVRIWAGSDRAFRDGEGRDARFNETWGVASDDEGNVFVADGSSIRKISSARVVTTLAGSAHLGGSADGQGGAREIHAPSAVVVREDGSVVVADAGNFLLRTVSPGGKLEVLAGSGLAGTRDGSLADAQFSHISGLAIAGDDLFVAELLLIRKVTSTAVTTLAGSTDSGLVRDGLGREARFGGISGIAADRNGNLFVADQGAHAIRRVSPDGSVVTFAGKLGERGSEDGSGDAARFSNLEGIAVAPSGDFYVQDYGTIRRITPDGVVSTVAGAFADIRWKDGIGSQARFAGSAGIAVGPDGSIFIAENVARVRKIEADGEVTTIGGPTLDPDTGASLTGHVDAIGSSALFSTLSGIAVDAEGIIYVVDRTNHVIRSGTPIAAGTPQIVSHPADVMIKGGMPASFTVAVQGTLPCTFKWQWRHGGRLDWADVPDEPRFSGTSTETLRIEPAVVQMNGDEFRCVVVNAAGRALTIPAVLAVVVPKLQVDVQPVSTAATEGFQASFFSNGSGVPNALTGRWQRSTDGGATWSDLSGSEQGVSGTRSPTLKLLTSGDMAGHQFRAVLGNGWAEDAISDPAGLTVFPAEPYKFLTDAILLRSPESPGYWWYYSDERSIAVDPWGTIYVAQRSRNVIHRIRPKKPIRADLDLQHPYLPELPDAEITVFAGMPGEQGSTNGRGTAARFHDPSALATDAEGNVYVADVGNNVIRKISRWGDVTNFAGEVGATGYADGPGAVARFGWITGIAIGSNGDLFVADSGNSAVRQVSPAGVVSTVVGRPGELAAIDGSQESARFASLGAIALDGAGNIYVAESGTAVRKVSPTGAVSTVAGRVGSSEYRDGESGAARFTHIGGLAADGDGTVYIADRADGIVRKIAPTGRVTSLAGLLDQYWVDWSSAGGFYSDATGADARFCDPMGIVVDAAGVLHVVGAGEAGIRQGFRAGAPLEIRRHPRDFAAVEGGRAMFYLGAAGDSLAFQWQRLGDAGVWENLRESESYSGANSATLHVVGCVPAQDGERVRCVVSVGNGPATASSEAELRVYSEQAIETRLDAPAVSGGSSFAVHAVSRNPVALAYQWEESSDGGVTWQRIENGVEYSGVSTATLIVNRARLGMSELRWRPTASTGVEVLVGDAAQVTVIPGLFDGYYTGTIGSGGVGTWALKVNSDGTARFLGWFGSPRQIVSSVLAVAGDGGFSAVVQTGGHAGAGSKNVSAQSTSISITGQISAEGEVSGSLGDNDQPFYGALVSTTEDSFSGYYSALALGVSGGSVEALVVSDGRVFALVKTTGGWDVASGTISGDGTATFATDLGHELNVQLAWDGRVSASLAAPGSGGLAEFAGLSDDTESTSRLVAISTRSRSGRDDQTLIMGFAVVGEAPLEAVIRGVGPSLAALGVNDSLTDPELSVYAGGSLLLRNDDWGGSDAMRQSFLRLGMSPPLPQDSKDAALLTNVAPGVYTAHVSSKVTKSGIALVEVYDGESATATRFSALSTRTTAGVGDDTLIAGVVLTGNSPKRLLVRGVGPSLVKQGVGSAAVLKNPRLAVYRNSTVIAENDDWSGAPELIDAFAKTGTAAFDSPTSRDSAVVVTLMPGVYTVHVGSADGTTGVALVEIYEIP